MPASFESFALSPELLTVLSELGYSQPTQVQSEALPPLLAGKDLIGQSETGSGKTAAFGLALLSKIKIESAQVQSLVLCPTRELAAQVAKELRKLGRRLPGLQVRTVTGGEPVRSQATALRRGPHVIVATPGRLLDHLSRGNLELSAIASLVLDEADRMLEMGFQADLDAILREVPEERQTMLFSATFPQTIAELSQNHLHNAVRVTVKQPEKEVPAIRQVMLHAESEKKLSALLWTLGEHEYDSAIVFCNQKATVAQIERELHLKGASVGSLHGDLDQYERDRVVSLLRSRCVRILVATDVAARGLDISDLDLVVNYDLPNQADVYVHRIGRTGRAGRSGLAVSLVPEAERYRLKAYRSVAGEFEEGEWSRDVGMERLCRPPAMQMIQIWGGRKDKVRPGDILGALTGDSGGLDASKIGKIEIHDRVSLVAVSLADSSQAAKSLSNGKIKGRRFKSALLR